MRIYVEKAKDHILKAEKSTSNQHEIAESLLAIAYLLLDKAESGKHE